MKNKIPTDEQIIELIKSHLYESLDILNNIEVRKHKRFVCENCKKTFDERNRRRKGEKEYCYTCYLELGYGKQMWGSSPKSLLDISNMKEENIPHLILNHTKQPIIANQPITDSMVDKLKNKRRKHENQIERE